MFTFILLIITILSIWSIFGQNITINTILGDVIGKQMDGFVSFKGIPYSENAPIGNFRFTESVVRISAFPTDPYSALDFSSSCIQSTISFNQGS